MTGRGEGYCVRELPEADRPARGYAGVEAMPVRLEPPAARPARRTSRAMWLGPAFRYGRGRAARRGRGRWLPRW